VKLEKKLRVNWKKKTIVKNGIRTHALSDLTMTPEELYHSAIGSARLLVHGLPSVPCSRGNGRTGRKALSAE
jgi:hypothetical protein